MADSLEQTVVKIALHYGKRAVKGQPNKPTPGTGLCGELVRKILTDAKAKTDYDYVGGSGKFTPSTAWGKKDGDLIPGYVIVFLPGGQYTSQKWFDNGSETNVTKFDEHGHVAVIVDVKPGYIITIVHQNCDPKKSGPHGTVIDMSTYTGKYLTFAPEPAAQATQKPATKPAAKPVSKPAKKPAAAKKK